MIDRNARKLAAENVRHFVNGGITNFELEESQPNTEDKAVLAIYDSLWLFYDDFRTHKLVSEHALPESTKKAMARWLMFLYTDQEYVWPAIAYPGARPLEHGLLSKILRRPAKESSFMRQGSYEFWPFISEQAYLQAKQNPCLLSSTLQGAAAEPHAGQDLEQYDN